MTWEQVGTFGVDAGLCWIGDPCYVMGDDASSRVTDWMGFCENLSSSGHDKNGHSTPLGDGTGIAISTGYGDGCYPVFIKRSDEGRVAEVKIVFIEKEIAEDDDDYGF